MASENNDISDIVKKCKILLLDIEGTTTSISFVKDKLFPYAEANVKGFLDSHWDKDDVKEVVAALRKLAIEDKENNVVGVVAIPGEDAGKDDQIDGLVKSVQWQMSADRKVGPLKQLQGLIWKQGYDNGDIKGHVYDDVSPALEQWCSTEGQKVYIYSSGSVQAQKLLFGMSSAGDLLPMIEGHFDTAIGAKQEPASYAAIVEKIGCKPEEILFLSDIVKEVEAARASGLQVALVSREGNAPLPAEATAAYPVLHSFTQLTVTNKRKPDPQEQEVPAKVPKTDIEADVKTSSDTEAIETASVTSASETVDPSKEATSASVTAEEPEKMEVEEEVVENITVTKQVENVPETDKDTPVRVETMVEEVTDSNEAVDAAVCDIEPVIEESTEKTEKNETEQMEIESTENVDTDETVKEPKETAKDKIHNQTTPIDEETVTVQDVTNDIQSISETAEIIDDLVPVVEEPSPVEMEDLQNVGEVLEKECDEILSKVQNVTNLDNITIKPMLNSIPEESIDAENGENTNDIVESILDSEMELAEKPCEVIDVNTVEKIEDVQTEKDVEKPTENSVEHVIEKISGENNALKTVEKENITDVKMEESSSIEAVTYEIQKKDITKDESVVTTVVNNVDAQESELDKISKTEEPADVTVELKSNVATENKEIPADIIEPEKPKTNSTEANKMDTDANTTVTDNKLETKTIAEQIKTKENGDESNAVEVLVRANEITTETVEKKSEPIESSVSPAENDIKSDNTATEAVNTQKDSENIESVAKNTETKESVTTQSVEKMDSEVSTAPQAENKMDTEVSTQETQTEAKVTEPEAPPPESKVEENNTDNKEVPKPVAEPVKESKDSAPGVQMESEPTKPQVNGKANCEIGVNLNGDASKDEELHARLSVENGKNGKEVNGANGNGDAEIEMGQGDNKVATEIPDIKVKTVASDEPRTDPIEQPTEA